MPFATTRDGTRLHHEVAGQGPALVLISGQAFDASMWADSVADFAPHRQVITFDHRGTGQSDKPTQPPYSTQGFAQDVVDLLDHLGIAQADVYGFSMGGRVAQWLAIDHAERVRCLVLGATTPGNAHGVRRPPEVDAILASGQQAALLDTLVSPAWRAAHPVWRQRMAERAQHPIPSHAQRLHYLASESHEAWDALPRITAPTLVVHGSADVVNVTANAHLLVQRIAGAQLCLIDGARHGYVWEQREQANAAVLAFLLAQR